MRWTHLAIAAAVGLAVAGEATASPPQGRWFVERVGDTILENNDATRVSWIAFRDGHVFGSGGCNTFQAKYRVSRGRLIMDRMSSKITVVACFGPDGAEFQDDDGLVMQSTLSAVRFRLLKNGHAELVDDKGVVTVLRPAPELTKP
jgi:heat shock protein HslJ